MKNYERIPLIVLLLLILVVTLAGMLLAPLGYDAISMACSAAACVLSAGMIFYCLYFWKRDNKE